MAATTSWRAEPDSSQLGIGGLPPFWGGRPPAGAPSMFGGAGSGSSQASAAKSAAADPSNPLAGCHAGSTSSEAPAFDGSGGVGAPGGDDDGARSQAEAAAAGMAASAGFPVGDTLIGGLPPAPWLANRALFNVGPEVQSPPRDGVDAASCSSSQSRVRLSPASAVADSLGRLSLKRKWQLAQQDGVTAMGSTGPGSESVDSPNPDPRSKRPAVEGDEADGKRPEVMPPSPPMLGRRAPGGGGDGRRARIGGAMPKWRRRLRRPRNESAGVHGSEGGIKSRPLEVRRGWGAGYCHVCGGDRDIGDCSCAAYRQVRLGADSVVRRRMSPLDIEWSAGGEAIPRPLPRVVIAKDVTDDGLALTVRPPFARYMSAVANPRSAVVPFSGSREQDTPDITRMDGSVDGGHEGVTIEMLGSDSEEEAMPPKFAPPPRVVEPDEDDSVGSRRPSSWFARGGAHRRPWTKWPKRSDTAAGAARKSTAGGSTSAASSTSQTWQRGAKPGFFAGAHHSASKPASGVTTAGGGPTASNGSPRGDRKTGKAAAGMANEHSTVEVEELPDDYEEDDMGDV